MRAALTPNRLAGATILSLLLGAGVNASVAAEHPLDALDAEEITAAVALLFDTSRFDAGTLFSSITLQEPLKAAVLAWTEGSPIPRAAEVIMRHQGSTYRAAVDLDARRVTSIEEIPGAQPIVVLPEFLSAMQATIGDPRFQTGLEKRGITDPEALFCAPRTAGNFGRPEEMTRRILKVDCFDTTGIVTDVFANPIEGLFALVDIDTNEVLEVTDLGVVPTPSGPSELDPQSVGRQREVKPVVQALPLGANVVFDGSFVHWQKWSFHLRWDTRSGVVLSQLRFAEDDEREPRSILYQGSLSEIFVPYQDPTEGWYYRNYMDEGEYGIGTMATRLVAGADCPASSHFLSPVMANAAGEPASLENRICIFERAPGDPLWRHFDIVTEAMESRPALELVVRHIATVGNYDYAFDWVMDQKGSFTFRGGATGIDSVKGVRAQSLDDPTAAEDTAWGPLIAPGRAGIHHDHFFSIRLDLDVDGVRNSFVRDRLVAERLPAHSPRRSVWRVQPEIAKTDTEAKFRLSYEKPALWRVVNPHKKNSLGYPVSYALRTAGNALPLVDEDDVPLSRALFATHHLWVTPYSPKERYAAGDFPNQSTPGQGLPAWTADRRSVEDEDIVLWYTLGFHHVPSAEDWPVYNLGWHSLTLRPYNFFDRNPALDVPPVEKTEQLPSAGSGI